MISFQNPVAAGSISSDVEHINGQLGATVGQQVTMLGLAPTGSRPPGLGTGGDREILMV